MSEKRKTADLTAMLEEGNCRALALQALKRALAATRSFAQNGKTVTEPDFKTRTQAATVLLAYSDGRPVERQLISISGQQREETAEEHAERIGHALGLPYGRGTSLLKRKRPITSKVKAVKHPRHLDAPDPDHPAGR